MSNIERITGLIEFKKARLESKLNEYKNYLISQSNWCKSSIDASNTASTCSMFARDIAKIEGEIDALMDMYYNP